MLFEKIDLDNLSEDEFSEYNIFFYEENTTTNLIKFIKRPNSNETALCKYNLKKTHYFQELNLGVVYYECPIFNYEFIIGKTYNNIYVVFDDYNKQIRFIDNINTFIKWFFEWSGFFSNECGCSCSWCIDDYIDIYKVKLKLEYLDKQIIINKINQL